ncbi:transcription antitermination factor NusB [Savagea sp. SN6]|uniref:Transcription antitermination protein NusB n=1 Tax=Savagea serpentis TaxID=2785297 RepID=A0A8J7KGV6_9BACL|nr:transcription antitermination factor NusB [Savagea serpentis]MBF4500263.1 transcription antitermination factor NusB [Savagea serpentis]
MKRHEAREKAVQTLFQLDETEITLEEAIPFIVEIPLDEFYEQLVRGTVAYREEIDALIAEHLENWSFGRLPKIERTILRLAVYEMNYTEVPARVVVNEAIELCKTFSDEKSGKFVNGVLSKMNK